MSDLYKDREVGRRATEAFKRLVNGKYPEYLVNSVEGTPLDLKEGQDYILRLPNDVTYGGSHRHVRADFKDYFCIRYSRRSGYKTDFEKLESKPDNHLFSFSWGSIDHMQGAKVINAKQLRAWITEHTDLAPYLRNLYGDGNLFLMIPVEDIEYRGIQESNLAVNQV